MNFQNIVDQLQKLSHPQKARTLQTFFKTGAGQYGEGDIFFGVAVGQIRGVVRAFKDVPTREIVKLLKHPVHEVRLAGVLLMVEKYEHDSENIFQLYLKNAKRINNWDLVDSSADKIVGRHLLDQNKNVLYDLAKSQNLWERRIAMIATFYEIKKGRSETTLKIAKMLLNDQHDLIHKAVGWMLREVGKRCSQEIEEEFLKQHAQKMPRTMLRYAIERFSDDKRQYYLHFKGVA